MSVTMTRDASWIEREYNDEKFAHIAAVIEGAIDRHGRDLSRVIWQVLREFRGHPGAELTPTVYDGRAVAVPRVAMWEAYHGAVAELLVGACRAETDVVAELGSGWGLYLFQLWLRGAPARARYFGFELTENGRRSTARLAALADGLDLAAVPFDFYHPDYAAAGAAGRRHALVYTCTAIEQIPHLPRAAIVGALGLADEVTGIHLEPIGWQFRAERGRPDILGSSRAYAERHDYSRDLWAVLVGLEDEGLIAIEEAHPDLLGSGPTNCLSYVRWKKV